jgi:hypothetical protein
VWVVVVVVVVVVVAWVCGRRTLEVERQGERARARGRHTEAAAGSAGTTNMRRCTQRTGRSTRAAPHALPDDTRQARETHALRAQAWAPFSPPKLLALSRARC